MSTCTTIQGDTFDILAKKIYGDEKYIELLIGANPRYCGVIIFSAGVVLSVPDLPDTIATREGFPSWRSEA